jgi:hypothetical protein
MSMSATVFGRTRKRVVRMPAPLLALACDS